ncbi:hypothetical protein PC129_g25205 [Phytophthora cactorum]|uniref:Uncharacterized protein n=1 Tax=Phytophthora cactorum TaxID=29920 RepID=A0A8T1GUK9_9STRA|nr:hypothetical protein PC129_g25205 [Phytophthora cactorum]
MVHPEAGYKAMPQDAGPVTIPRNWESNKAAKSAKSEHIVTRE